MGTSNQCSLYEYFVRMATFALSCSVLVFIIMVATSLASSRMRRDIPTAGSLIWKDTVPDYPEAVANEHVAQLERENKMLYFLTSDKIKELNKHAALKAQNQTKTQDLCSSVVKMHIPKSVQIDDDLYYVLNPEANPLQYFESEECNMNVVGKTCNFVAEPLAGYRTGCKQEYMTRELYLMDKNNPRNLRVLLVDIESCCSCFLFY